MSPDDDGYIGYVLSDVARLMRTVFDRRVRRLGLTRAQWLSSPASIAGPAPARRNLQKCSRSIAPAPAA